MNREDFFSLLADQLSKIDSSLEQAGFRSCLVDRDWMRSHSSEAEWQDFLVYRREYAREVLQSDSPAAIEHSNPGEYEWHSSVIADRVLQRFRKFGDVHAQFLNGTTRHLTELTVPAQRLSKIMERASASDIQECERRLEEFDIRYVRELLETRNEDPLVQRVCEDPGATPADVQRLFVRMMMARILGKIAPGPTSIRLTPVDDQFIRYVEFQLEVDPEDFVRKARGTLYLTASYGSALSPSTLPLGFWLHITQVLPGRFRDYSRFTSQAEFVLCFSAWLHVASHITRGLLAERWRWVGDHK